MNVYIIAEAGVNHNGNLGLAKNMVDRAQEAGADCIKFQTFVAHRLVSQSASKAEYQLENTDTTETQLEMIKKLELSFAEFIELSKYCRFKGIDFLSTPFDDESIDFLNDLGMDVWKIPSGEITNLPYLIKIARLKKKVILSTGMSNMDEVEAAVNVLKENGAREIVLLHCTTEYPAPYADVNLHAMMAMREKFSLDVGYSDHTLGSEVSIAAVALGAVVLEKHFTLDRNMDGPDHKASLEPSELKLMIEAIRNIEISLGSKEKKPAESEIKNIPIARKSIVAMQDIKKGEVFTIENITTKRPGTGISPMKWFDVLGQTAVRDFAEDEIIEV